MSISAWCWTMQTTFELFEVVTNFARNQFPKKSQSQVWDFASQHCTSRTGVSEALQLEVLRGDWWHALFQSILFPSSMLNVHFSSTRYPRLLVLIVWDTCFALPRIWTFTLSGCGRWVDEGQNHTILQAEGGDQCDPLMPLSYFLS